MMPSLPFELLYDIVGEALAPTNADTFIPTKSKDAFRDITGLLGSCKRLRCIALQVWFVTFRPHVGDSGSVESGLIGGSDFNGMCDLFSAARDIYLREGACPSLERFARVRSVSISLAKGSSDSSTNNHHHHQSSPSSPTHGNCTNGTGVLSCCASVLYSLPDTLQALECRDAVSLLKHSDALDAIPLRFPLLRSLRLDGGNDGPRTMPSDIRSGSDLGVRLGKSLAGLKCLKFLSLDLHLSPPRTAVECMCDDVECARCWDAKAGETEKAEKEASLALAKACSGLEVLEWAWWFQKDGAEKRLRVQIERKMIRGREDIKLVRSYVPYVLP